jgi:hypothetical protein
MMRVRAALTLWNGSTTAVLAIVILRARKRAVRSRAGDRSPPRAGVQLWVRIFRPQSQPTRPLLRGGRRLHDFGIMEECH